MHNMDTTPKIMVIDDGELDNFIFQLVVKRTLNFSKIESWKNGISALERIKQLIDTQPDELPDYIFLDIRMPQMDGWEFLNQYKNLKIEPIHKSKIYMLSSSVDRQDLEMSVNDPAVEAYIPKPITVNNVKSIFQVS
jgi:CheY-like chemotaxis protein